MCILRRLFLPSEFTLDHIIPISKGGATRIKNCVVCCKECNEKKADKFIYDCMDIIKTDIAIDKILPKIKEYYSSSGNSYERSNVMVYMNIEWHEECYKNRMRTLEKTKEELDNLTEKYEKDKKSCDIYRRQIERAKRLGKLKFDSDRFKPGESNENICNIRN